MALTNVAFQSNPPLVEPDPGDPTKPDVGLPLDPITGEPVIPTDPANPPVVDPTPPTTVTPPVDCIAPTCVTTTTPVVPPVKSIAISKTASSAAVSNGQTLTYTVTVTNDGDVPFTATDPASFVDDLSGVLDDGVLTGTPTASAGFVSVVGDRIVWSGPVSLTEPVTVSYTVVITPGGDRVLTNVAFDTTGLPTDPVTGEPVDPANPDVPIAPPADCVAPECATTTTPARTLAVAKSASVSTVAPGAQITYTISVTNTGSAAFTDESPATVVDDLSGVLDDATLSGVPNASGGGGFVRDGRLVWTGALGVGETATISYTVVAKPGGDRVAKNVVFDTTGWSTDPVTGIPTNPILGGPATPPLDCAAPSCATTSTAVSLLPDKKPGLPSTGSDLGLGLLASVVVTAGLGFAALRRRSG